MQNILFHPYYSRSNEYVNKTIEILKKRYKVHDYSRFKSGDLNLDHYDCIFFNWIEDKLDDKDREIIQQSKANNKKIIWVFHNKMPHDLSGDKSSSNNISYMAKNADTIVIHSTKSRAFLEKEFGKDIGDKTIFVPHVNYFGAYQGYLGDVRKILGIDDSCLLLGFIGQIRPYKNIEILIDVIRHIDNENIALLIAGMGNSEYVEELKKRIAGDSRIILCEGMISNYAMSNYLDAVDVVVMPYSIRSSLNSGSMIMAFSYGKSVIIPQIEMTKDFPKELFYCYEYKTDDEHYEELKKAVEAAILDGKGILKTKGEKARGFVGANNSEKCVANELYSIIDGAQSVDNNTLIEYEIKRSSEDYRFRVLNQWFLNELRDIKLSIFLKIHNLKTIAIYGMGDLGKDLLEYFERNNVPIAYGIDISKPKGLGIQVFSPYDKLPVVDLLIVTIEDAQWVGRTIQMPENAVCITLEGIAQCLDNRSRLIESLHKE